MEYTSTQATSTAGTAMNLSLSYNLTGGDNGTLTSIANNADHGRDQTLTYDPLNRILSAQSSATSGADCWGQNFGTDGTVADDAVANLTKINNGTQPPLPCAFGLLNTTVDANNHINTDSTYAYDAAGNMTKDGSGTGWLYTFDAENRLSFLTGPADGPYCYIYDGLGLRVAKKSSATTCASGTVTKLYWRSLSGDALAETDGTGSVTTNYTEYVFFAGRRIASRVTGSNSANTALFYYFADQLGSTRTITTGSGKNNDGSNQTPGQLCYDADFTPYGQEISYTTRLQTTACPPKYKFTGYERDSETGLDYAFARYYSSRLGRFLSTDPLGGAIGDLQSHNAYAYVTNNPLNLTDRWGLCGGPHGRPCPDGDNPCFYAACAGGGGGPGCGLDCASGAGFVGMLGGNGTYAGNCPAEYQGCLANGTGGFIGITGTSLNNCSASNVCAQLSGSSGVAYEYTPGGYVCTSVIGLIVSDPICQLFPPHLDVTTDSSDPQIGMPGVFQFGAFTQAYTVVEAGTVVVAVEAAPVVAIEAAPAAAAAYSSPYLQYNVLQFGYSFANVYAFGPTKVPIDKTSVGGWLGYTFGLLAWWSED